MMYKILITFVLLGMLNFKLSAKSNSCIIQDYEAINTIFIHPIYKINVNYFFETENKKAYAIIGWEFDEENTRKCFYDKQNQFSTQKILIPAVSVSDVQIKIFGSDEFVKITPFPNANGHWSSSTQYVPIAYSLKQKIKDAMDKEIPIAQFSGDPRMKIMTIERAPILHLNCTEKMEEVGVLNLFTRLKQIKEKTDSLPPSHGVRAEDVLQSFLGNCVEFKPVTASSFKQFEQEQKINSKIHNREFSIFGNVTKSSLIKMEGFLKQNVTIQEL
jgi:hypothetical protein